VAAAAAILQCMDLSMLPCICHPYVLHGKSLVDGHLP